MATIPLGNAGRATPGRVPAPQMQEAGVAQGRALERLGATGVQAGQQFAADQQRLDQQALQQYQEEQRRQAAAAEAAARAADAVQLQNTEDALTDAHDELANQVLQGQVPKDKAGEEWATRSKKVVDDSLPAFREGTRAIVAPRLAGAGNRLGNSLRRTVEKKDRQDVTADMTTRLERLGRDYQTDPARAETEAMALFDTLGPYSNLTPDQLAKARQGWKEQAQYTAGFEAVSLGRNDRKALQAAEQKIGTLADLDPQKRAVLLDRVAGYRAHLDQQAEMAQQRAARQAEAGMRKAQAEFNAFQALADKGTTLDPAYVDRVLSATAGTPYQAAIRTLAQQARETGGLAAQPVAQQRAMLDAIDARIATGGRTPELDKRREQVAKVLAGAEGDLSRDGLRAGLERGVIARLEPLSLTGGIEGVAAQLGARAQQADAVRSWAGRPVSPLLPEEAQGLARMLSAMDPAQKGAAVAALASNMPSEQAQALARQVDVHDKPLALALAVGAGRTTQGRTTAELILRGAQAIKDKAIKEEQGAEFGVRAQMAQAVGDAVPAAVRDDVIAAARLIYLGKQAAGESMSAAGAVRLAIGGDVVEHNGRRLPLPVGMDAGTLRTKLSAMAPAALDSQAPDGVVYLSGGRPMGVPEFLARLPDAQLEPAGLGRFMVRSGGALVLGANRQPIVVDVR